MFSSGAMFAEENIIIDLRTGRPSIDVAADTYVEGALVVMKFEGYKATYSHMDRIFNLYNASTNRPIISPVCIEPASELKRINIHKRSGRVYLS